MGYARYEITRRDGKTVEAGYDVETICEEPGCTETIDRGLGCLCGNEPGNPEYGCGGYFCGQHLFTGPNAKTGDLCAPCRNAMDTAA